MGREEEDDTLALPSLISFPFTVLAPLHSPHIIRPVKAAISRTAMSICCQISSGLFVTIRGNFREEKLAKISALGV